MATTDISKNIYCVEFYFEPVMTIFNVNNLNILLAFPEINGRKFYSYIKVRIPMIHLSFDTEKTFFISPRRILIDLGMKSY